MKTTIISKTDKDRCNCVIYCRAQAKFKFPYNLWTLDDKKAIINYSKPIAGAVAMTSDGVWYIRNGKKVFSGHTAIVESVKGNIITIREANYKKCLITRRSGTAKELKIVGYRVDKIPSVPQKPPVSDVYKKMYGICHPKLIKCNKELKSWKDKAIKCERSFEDFKKAAGKRSEAFRLKIETIEKMNAGKIEALKTEITQLKGRIKELKEKDKPMDFAPWRSRKLILSILAALIIILNDAFGWGLAAETINNLLIAFGSFIGIEGIADIVERFKK